jgi:nucleoside-diphosphate-sugar epimerase
VDEAHPIRPVDVNGINKTAGEWYHLLYHTNYGIPCTVLRLTNTYGPRMRARDARQTFLGVWIRLLVQGQPIQVFGDGQQRRDLNYVTDVVEALLLAGASPRAIGKVYNLGATEVVSLRELAAMLVEVNGGGRYELIPFPDELRKIDVGDYYGDFRKIETELGWSPKVCLRDGLRQTLEFYRRNGAHYWE